MTTLEWWLYIVTNFHQEDLIWTHIWVEQGNDTMRITVKLTDPGPHTNVTLLPTCPYEVLRIPRTAPITNWEVWTTDGELLAQTTYP